MPETIQQSDWDGVYYDRQAGEFFVMEVGDESVTLIDAFTGMTFESLEMVEFKDCARDGDFDSISEEVLRDPAEYVEVLLHEVPGIIDGQYASLTGYDPIDVDFAINATNLSYDDDAPFTNAVQD